MLTIYLTPHLEYNVPPQLCEMHEVTLLPGHPFTLCLELNHVHLNLKDVLGGISHFMP